MSLQNTRSQYTYSQLDDNTLKDKPEVQLATWLEEAKAADIVDYHACCIATATKTGVVGARYVLLRALDHKGLVFYTNRESEKGQHITQNPQGQMLFFWREFNRQVRVSGALVELDRKTVESYFQSRPIGNQQATAASAQSQPIADRKALETAFKNTEKKYPTYVPTPATWTGFRLIPHYWEFWQGRPNRLHDRLCYLWNKKDEQWQVQRLQP